MHIVTAAQIGAHVATAPASVFRQMLKHPLTDAGLETFKQDWLASGQKI
jgi:transaldolase